jgi:pilus assembly protein Flp/PilA
MNLMMFKPYLGLLLNKKGQGMVEYALIIALIAVVVAVALALLGPQIATLFRGIGENLPTVGTEAP